MNKDQVKGRVEEAKGKVKEEIYYSNNLHLFILLINGRPKVHNILNLD